jgi:hypothetical protein
MMTFRGSSFRASPFTLCHPVLTVEARIALTLRLLCGLTTAEIRNAVNDCIGIGGSLDEGRLFAPALKANITDPMTPHQ